MGSAGPGDVRGCRFLGGGLYGGLRFGPRSRITATLNGGDLSGRAAVRAELAGHFLLSPRNARRGLYGGGGLAGVFGRHVTQGYVMLLLGLESHPGGPGGWVVEAGLGGGVRLQAGYRWRSRPRR